MFAYIIQTMKSFVFNQKKKQTQNWMLELHEEIY